MKFFVLFFSLLTAVGAAKSFLRKTSSKDYPPKSCSCACCIVHNGQGGMGCNVPSPTHWKHHACTFALCGNGQVLADNGPKFAENKKRDFCEAHCGVAKDAAVGDNCVCKNGNEDPWSCPHGDEWKQ